MGCCDWHEAIEAVDYMLLHGLGLSRVAKQLDPLDDRDFVIISNRLRRQFVEIAGPVEARQVAAAIEALDVDWVNMTAAQTDAVVRAANEALRDIPPAVMPAITQEYTTGMLGVLAETKEAVADRFRLSIGTSLDAVDRAAVESAARSQSIFATDVYGARVTEFDEVARATIADGLERGLRSPEIASNLAGHARRIGLERSQSYWQTVSSAGVNRSRVFGALRGFEEAEIERYRFDAVLDERTTNVCRMMDGKVFTVRSGLQKIAEADEGDVKQVQPWVRQRRMEDGRIEMFTRTDDGDTTIGIVEESAVGRLDERGRFSNELTTDQLVDAGVVLPPLHGLCRSTVLPIL